MSQITRREFVASVPGIGVVAAAGGIPALAAQVETPPERNEVIWPEFPHQNPAWVREMVGVCHFNVDRARELLDEHPALVNATWDWGFGDWETALGAAAHTGRRNIAELLLERGARLDIFAAAMLGQTDTVKAMIAAAPGIQRNGGPHGITLLSHARAGGDAAKETLVYVESLGDADFKPKTEPLSDEQSLAYVGRFASPLLGQGVVEISIKKGGLALAVDDQPWRALHHVGDHAFFPAGAPAVRVRFADSGSRISGLTIVDHATVLTAIRIS